MHGKTSQVHHDGRTIYAGMAQPFQAGRYHSLTIDQERLPDVLEITARSESGEVMGVRHRARPAEGVQFHPESILTPEGGRLLGNFLAMTPAARST
jgi:anthranilate synthase component 2/para-aminobenzoate synthetase component 2